MTPMHLQRITTAILGAAFVLTGCSTNKPPEPPTAPAAPPGPPAAGPAAAVSPPDAPASARSAGTPRPATPRPGGGGTLGDGVRWFRVSAEYGAIARSVYRAATEAVTNAANGKARDSWAVVLDADETVLDNSVFQRDLTRGTAPFSEELWATFVRTRSSIPVPGAKAFLERVRDLGGRIVIVTNRFDNLCDDTRENFKLQGLPFDVVLCRAQAGKNTGDKNPRFAAAATGAAFGDTKAREVLAFVGDNIHDFPAMSQTLRDKPDADYADFGRRFFILPNPMYGSWQQVPAR